MSVLGKNKVSALQYLYLAEEGAHSPGNAQAALGTVARVTVGLKGHQAGVGNLPAATLRDLDKRGVFSLMLSLHLS